MKAITLRGIDEVTYSTIKKVSQCEHKSMNKYILTVIKDNLGIEKKAQNKEFERFFGSWSEEEYKDFLKNTQCFNTIDKEFWGQ